MRRLRTATAASLMLLAHALAVAAPAPTKSAQNAPIEPVGPITMIYVLHFAPEPRGDVMKQANELLQTKFPTLKRLTRRDEVVAEPAVFIEVVNMKTEGFAPPSLDTLKYFGRGVSREQAEAMQKSTVAAGVTFTYRAADAFKSIARADELIKELALRAGGLIWDEETRQLFTPESLAELRLAKPTDNAAPDVHAHVTMHAYKSDEYVRAITLGMRKFGLPDIVINDFSWSLNTQMGNTINLFAQSLLEGARPKLGAYDLEVSKIKHAGMRDVYEKHLLDGSKPVALLTLADAARDEGDPDNRLIELRFDRYAGNSVHEKHQKFATTFYGSAESVARIKHNDAIRAASERARQRLPELRKAFNAGLRPGERILLKAPFERRGGGNEWMWVEVISWRGDAIRGLLDNEPDDVPDLHAGATVDVREQDIFDYIRYKADGSEEGNETGREIEKLQNGE